MDVLQGDPPSPSRCCTPPPSLPGVAAVTGPTPSPPTPPKKKRRSAAYYTVKFMLPLLEEIYQIHMEEKRKWQSSEEALEAERKRKMRILMSLR